MMIWDVLLLIYIGGCAFALVDLLLCFAIVSSEMRVPAFLDGAIGRHGPIVGSLTIFLGLAFRIAVWPLFYWHYYLTPNVLGRLKNRIEAKLNEIENP